MTDDAFERVLRLVAEGRLSAEEAGPILDALGDRGPAGPRPTQPPGTGSATSSADTPFRVIRIEVSDEGRKVVNLRVPIALGRAALGRIPGLNESVAERIREAIAGGIRGPIVDVDDDGDGVRITLE